MSGLRALTVALLLFASGFIGRPASAHCDGLDGPVVQAAEKALSTGNVNLALAWVAKDSEGEIRRAFEQALAVRKLSPEARELADRHFFETLVRIHRAGEGAPYTGLKPAGRDLGPAIPAADKALATGSVEELAKLLREAVEHGLVERFRAVLARKGLDPNDPEAGRAYVKAYVEFVHYVEGVYEAAAKEKHRHSTDDEDHDRHPR